MRNRKAILWLLLAVFLLAGANVMLSWYGKDSVDIVRRQNLVNSTSWVNEIAINRSGSLPVRLEKKPAWRMVAPFQSNVDEAVILRLLDALAFTPIDDSVTEAELLKMGRSRADFKLDNPRLEIELMGANRKISLRIGDNTPSRAAVYACLAGEQQVHTITNSILAATDLSADSLRMRSLFPAVGEAVTMLEVKKGSSVPIVFTSSDAGWKVGEAKASVKKVKEFISSLLEARAIDFVWPTGATNENQVASAALLSGYGLDAESAIAITVRSVDGVSQDMLLGKEAGNEKAYAFAHSSGAVVTVPAKLLFMAQQEVVAFTDSRLFPFELGSVQSFQLSFADVHCSLARGEGDAWRMDSPISAPASVEVVKNMLEKVLSLSSADISASGVTVSVTTNSAPVVVAADKVLGDGRLEDLRSLEMLKVDSSLIKRVVSSVSGSAKPDAVLFDRDRRIWKVESSAKDGVADSAGIERILKVICPLKASRVEKLKVSATDLERYGLDHPFATIAIDLDREDAIRRNIIIGGAVEGGRYATIGSSDAIFVLPDAVVDELCATIIGK